MICLAGQVFKSQLSAPCSQTRVPVIEAVYPLLELSNSTLLLHYRAFQASFDKQYEHSSSGIATSFGVLCPAKTVFQASYKLCFTVGFHLLAMQRVRTKATTCHTKAEEPRAGCRQRQGRRQSAGGSKTTSARCQPYIRDVESWGAAAASKGAGVWWVRERRGKRAEKSGFACTVLSSYSSKSSSRQGGRQPPSHQRDRTKGRQLYMDKVGEKGRAVGKKSCTSQHLWKLQLLQGHLRGNGIAQTRGSDQVRERLHLHRSEQIRGNVICGITELHRSVPLGLSCKSASAGEGCAC